jgi:hypothetical protein
VNTSENNTAANSAKPVGTNHLPASKSVDKSEAAAAESAIGNSSGSKPPAKNPGKVSADSGGPKSKTPPKSSAKPEKKPDPMEGVFLVVLLKSGEAHEFKMVNVDRFSVDRGLLVVQAKDGTTSRYSLTDVAKVTMQ